MDFLEAGNAEILRFAQDDSGESGNSKLYIAAGMSDLRLKLPKDLGKILALRRR